MSNYRKFAAAFILTELMLMLIINLAAYRIVSTNTGKYYKVEINRIAGRINNGEAVETIDTSAYKAVCAVSVFDAGKKYANEYEVKQIGAELYCFEYREDRLRSLFPVLNLMLGVIVAATVVLLVYLDRKMIAPFAKMNKLPAELAKGNLSMPLKQEKSKYFGKFLWGMDMLRETLEDDKKRELELQKEKKTLILSLSHDIKTPLSAIDLYAKTLKRNMYESQAERDAALEGIENNVVKIKSYVNEIATASREDFLALEVKNSEVYLSRVIERIKLFYSEKMKNLHIRFTVEEMEECLIFGDEERIIEVIQNVVENAIKYGDKDKIAISVSEEENCKLLTVMNSGYPPAKEELPNLFDSFYRGSNCGNESGSGLGLYICKQLMQKMDGDIFAAAGEGSFSITLVLRKA